MKTFLNTWQVFFYKFMVGLGYEIIRATFYVAVGIGFIGTIFNIPPQAIILYGNLLISVVMSTALSVRIITFAWHFFASQQKRKGGPVEPANAR
jgi:hypothetical protein